MNTIWARRSAIAITTRGTTHKMGERYVTIRSTAMIAAVTLSRRKFAPEKTSTRSAETAAGPVTNVSTPSGAFAASSVRTSKTLCAPSCAPSSGTSKGMMAAVESSLGISGPPRSIANPCNFPRSSTLPVAESNSAMAVWASSPERCSRTSATNLESVPSGRLVVDDCGCSIAPMPMAKPAKTTSTSATHRGDLIDETVIATLLCTRIPNLASAKYIPL